MSLVDRRPPDRDRGLRSRREPRPDRAGARHRHPRLRRAHEGPRRGAGGAAARSVEPAHGHLRRRHAERHARRAPRHAGAGAAQEPLGLRHERDRLGVSLERARLRRGRIAARRRAGRGLASSSASSTTAAARCSRPGVAGELLVRGYTVMKEYYRKPAETAAAFDADGWMHTGDMRRCGADGYLRFMGRYKDMLKVGGENVDPMEIEGLSAGASRRAAGRRGRPARRAPGRGGGGLRPAQRRTRDLAEEVLATAAARIASFKIPRHVVFVDAFPMTESGKIQKAEAARSEARLSKEAVWRGHMSCSSLGGEEHEWHCSNDVGREARERYGEGNVRSLGCPPCRRGP